MKKALIRITTALLAVMMCLGTVACSTNQQKVAQDSTGKGNNYVSLAMYSLITAMMKGNLAYNITSKYGNYNSSDFWTTIVDGADQNITNKEYYTYVVDEKVRYFVAALNLFDELGLSLPQSEIDKIDEEMAEYIKVDGNGSKNALNSVLAVYGANYDTLRDYKIMNAKIAMLSNHIYYRDNGDIKIDDALQRKYFIENYVAFKQILIPTFYYIYHTDEYKDEIYFKVDPDGKLVPGSTVNGEQQYRIAYDIKNGSTLKSLNFTDKNIPERDVNGDEIYYFYDETTDNIRIAYDKIDGKRVAKDDNNDGYQDTAQYTDAEKKKKGEEAQELLNKISKGDYKTFEEYIIVYDENYSVSDDSMRGDIYFLATEKSYGTAPDNIKANIKELDNGEVTVCKSEYGYHIVMRYDIEGEIDKKNEYGEKLYETFSDFKKEYKDWFTDTNKVHDFDTDIVNEMFVERLEPYAAGVSFDENIKAEVDISTIKPNFNFY